MSLGPEPRSPSPGLLPLRAVASGIRVSLLPRTGVRPGRAAQEGEGFCVPTAGSARTAAFHPARPRSHPPPTGRLSPYSPFEQFLTGVTVNRGRSRRAPVAPASLRFPDHAAVTHRFKGADAGGPGVASAGGTALGQRASGRCRRTGHGQGKGVRGKRMLACTTWEGKWGPRKVCLCMSILKHLQ